MKQHLTMTGRFGGPSILFLFRYLPAIDDILTKHSAEFPCYDGCQYSIFYDFGGDIMNAPDRIGPVRYYAKAKYFSCNLSVSYERLMSLNHSELQQFLAEALEKCFALFWIRLSKITTEIDKDLFFEHAQRVVTDIQNCYIDQSESKLEKFYADKVIPVLESFFIDQQRKKGKSFGKKLSDLTRE